MAPWGPRAAPGPTRSPSMAPAPADGAAFLPEARPQSRARAPCGLESAAGASDEDEARAGAGGSSVRHFPEIRLDDPGSFAEGVPHEWFRVLRAEAPVYFHEASEGPGFWCVTRYDDVKQVSRNPRVFSSWLGGTNLLDLPEPDLNAVRAIMLNMDPPQHVKFRRLVQRGFTPRQVEQMRPRVREIARRIVDDVASKGQCDFVADVAAKLPLEVICDMMGVPERDRHGIFELSNRLIGFDDPEYQTSEQDGKIASAEMFTYAMHLAAKVMADPEPSDTLVHRLLSADVDGERLTELEFSSFFLLLAIAGNETTRTVTSWGMHAFIEHPDQQERVRRDPSLLPSAVEEILRFAPAVHHFRRTATCDTTIRGQAIPAGARVVIWYPSANRDESVFREPDRFDVTRQPNPHLSFGIGEHFCLGAHLARMELQEIFRELLRRIPDMELAGPPRRLRSNFVNGCKQMPVRFTPEE
jgi:cholest-4-en-3-one 26-monooxygenase